MKTALAVVAVLCGTNAVAAPRLLDGGAKEHRGWLVAGISSEPVAGKSKDALKGELTQLLAERPAVGGGIVMVVFGGLFAIGGLISSIPTLILLNNAYTSNQQIGLGFLVATIVGVVVGAVLILCGVVVIKAVGAQRRLYNDRIQEVESEIKRLDREEREKDRAQLPPPMFVPTQLASFQRGF